MNEKIYKNKIGSIVDVLFFEILISMLGIFIIFEVKLFNAINNEFQANPDLSSSTKTIMSDI